jgi:dipeptidyl aminopeptidase/acylaminoacyl peptidase
MRRLFPIFFLLLAVPAFSQSKRPFTFEDMMKLKRVGEPEVSPDGKWVIFSVVDVDLAANTRMPHIWIVPLAGGQERILLPKAYGYRPRWAPDSKRFAFISDGGRGSQVWIADFDSATGTITGSHELTAIPTEASGESWSPDGKNILFVSNVYPACDGAPEAEAACNAKKLDEHEKSPVKALIFDRLLYRHLNAYKEGKRSHIFVVPVLEDPPPPGRWPSMGSLTPRDLTPGDYDSQDDYALSHDGQEICFTSNHDKNEAASTNNDLWIIPVTGGPAKNITADNPASDSTPLYSPDGRYIAYRAQQRPGYESDRFRLMLYDRKTGEKKNLTEDFDRWVGTIAWHPDSLAIYYVSEDAGVSSIRNAVLTVISGNLIVPGNFSSHNLFNRADGYDDNLAVTRQGVVYTKMHATEPAEIYRAKVVCTGDGSTVSANACFVEETKLTHLNDAVLSQVSMSPLESFWFTGARGDQVEGFLVKPPNFDASKKYPVKFFLKGGPQIAWGDLWSYTGNFELFAANGYVVITINYHGSTGYGQKFIDAVNGDWGGAPFEDEMKGLDYAEKTYPFIDKDRECAIGSSYGGFMANWILGHTDRFKCIVSHHSVFNAEAFWGSTDELWYPDWDFEGTPYDDHAMYKKWSPHQYARNFKTPTLVIHGQNDYRADVSQSFQLFTTLQMLGVPSKMLYFPDEAQYPSKPQNSQLFYKTIDDWVDRWTKK